MRAMTSLSVAPLCADQVLPVCRKIVQMKIRASSGMPASSSAVFQIRLKLRRRGMPPCGPDEQSARWTRLGEAGQVRTRCRSEAPRGRLIGRLPASDFGSSSTWVPSSISAVALRTRSSIVSRSTLRRRSATSSPKRS